MLVKRMREAKSTIGEEIKKLKVTPSGSPAVVNPIKRGIEEQEQKDVTVPKSAAIIRAENPLQCESIFLLLSGGKYD